ncbi:DUF4265 domain-containing protein [Microbacterium sp. NPDC057650]|uniref:DUF4265 domain-containing protein n=1 Tax=unclassified Microbacterium TaxID=2609290 RepID=UPI00367060DF
MNIYRRHPSRVTSWSAGALAAIPPTVDEVEVWFALPSEGSDEQVWEALNAERVEDDVVALRGVPVLAEDLAYDDRVQFIQSAEGALVATRLVAAGEFATFRVWLGDADPSVVTWRAVAERLAKLGCLIDVYSEHLIALAVHRSRAGMARDALAALAHGTEWEETRSGD